jgi:hypothetical protein
VCVVLENYKFGFIIHYYNIIISKAAVVRHLLFFPLKKKKYIFIHLEIMQFSRNFARIKKSRMYICKFGFIIHYYNIIILKAAIVRYLLFLLSLHAWKIGNVRFI